MEAIHGACSTSQPSLLARSCTRSARPFCLVRARQPHDLWRHRAGERNGAPVTTVPAPTVSRPAMSERSMSSAQPEEQQSTPLWWLAVPLVAALATLPLGLDPIGAYTTALANHPFTTKLATGVTGAFIGDLVAQAAPALLASFKSKQTGRTASDAPVFKYDALRAARFMLFAIIGTPINVAWFNFLDANIMPHDPTAMQAVATKVAMDQLMMSPVMTSTFFAFMAAMQGQASKVPQIVLSKIVPTMKMNYMLWPAAHVLNFAFVPSDQRILFVNVVALAWNLILSSAAAAPAPASKK